MDKQNFKLAQQLINSSYVRLSQNSINKREKQMKQLLTQRQLPDQGLDQLTIKYFLDAIALMDSNNFDQKVGVGERESRIFSRIVEERHFHMGHGIGRSGDIMANQPKAAGSSLILQLVKYLTVSALKQLNYQFVSEVLILPLATGMSISLSLLMLAGLKPDKKYVIWSRIDQKTCLKAIQTANLIPIVIELKKDEDGDSLRSDVEAISQKIKQIGAEKVLCILSTTSCFAPRVPDDIEAISRIAKEQGVFHVVNNAYGLWCTKIANNIKQSFRSEIAQCTIVVQSTDKNFLVPVGGSIIFAKDQKLLDKISAKYPGRANGSPILDLFITLLSMGKQTIKDLKKQRKQNYAIMAAKGKQFAQKYNFNILATPSNTISIAMCLSPLLEQMQSCQLTQLGSILYSKRVMGHRVIVKREQKTQICGIQFSNYGSNSQNYASLPYMTFACAVGTKAGEIQVFFKRLGEAISELKKNVKKQAKKQQKKKSSIDQKEETQETVEDFKKEKKEEQDKTDLSKEFISWQHQNICDKQKNIKSLGD